MMIVFDGTERCALAICTAIRSIAPELSDDQAPSFLTQDGRPGEAFNLLLWTDEGEGSAETGDTVVIGTNSVTVEPSHKEPSDHE